MTRDQFTDDHTLEQVIFVAAFYSHGLFVILCIYFYIFSSSDPWRDKG